MLNRIIIMGRLTRDPELRRTQSGKAVVSFSLAVERDFKDQSTGERACDFIDVVGWGSTAEFVSKYFSKGRMAVVEGRLQLRDWEDRNGNKRRSAEVVASSVYFGDSKKDGNAAPRRADYQDSVNDYSNGSYPSSTTPDYSGTADFSELTDDDGELPF